MFKLVRRLFSRRVSRRRLRASYDAASNSDALSRYWVNADDLSANSANSAGIRKTLRGRSRYEIANNSYAKGIVLTLANDVIGTGPRLQIITGDPDANRRIEKEWQGWAEEVGLAQLLRTMHMARVGDGEAFALMTSRRHMNSEVELDFRLYEADQVATPDLMFLEPGHVDGIEFDEDGLPSYYHLLKQHPGDQAFASFTEYDRIPAWQMLHWFRCDRPGQARGIPDITPALPLFAQLRRFTLAVIAAAETAADFAAVIYSDATPPDEDEVEAEPFETVDIEHRTMTALPGGWKMAQFRPEQPATTYEAFKKELLNEIARCLNMPFNVAAANSSGYNYASGRLDHQTYWKAIRVEQATFERLILDRILAAWLDEAALIDGLLPDAGPIGTWNHQWFWDGHEHVDPLKEANAQAVRLANHTTTLADEYARRGQDWETQLRQRANELELMAELGLPADFAYAAEVDDDEER